MKLIKASNVFFVLLIVSSFSNQLLAYAEEKFSISNDRKSAKAIVSASKEFTVTFDPPLASKIKDYKPEDNRNFTLHVGSCKLNIFAQEKKVGEQKYVVDFGITDPSSNNPVPANNPTGFKVTTSGVKFDKTATICIDNIKFEPYPADANKFLVEVSLDGNFPASLGLKSEDALLYVDLSESRNKEVLPIWAWIIIAFGGGILVLILLITIIAVPVCIIKRRKQKTAQKSSDPTLKTATEKAKSNECIPTESVESKEHALVKQAKAKKVEDKQQVKSNNVPRVHKQASKENTQTTQEPGVKMFPIIKPRTSHYSDCFIYGKSGETAKREMEEIRKRTPPELFNEEDYLCTCYDRQ